MTELVKDSVEFVKQQFDKVILIAIFFGLLSFLLHVSHDAADKELVSFARELSGQVVAALLTLITTAKYRSGNGSSGGSVSHVSQESSSNKPTEKQ